MAEGTRYEGGLAEPGSGARKDAPGLRNFIGYEHRLGQHVLHVHVMGQVEVANPGIKATLSYLHDEDEAVLYLRLDLIQRPGIWPQLTTWVPANYAAALVDEGPFQRAQIIHGEVTVITVPIHR